ncbi:hypothetical protein [Gymnodinialimonas ulvae]|uniref:hypothetical protein n=1 Tax=Gymnodinialimonas ulvae TaxID=3126504 RepID=UPI0030A7AF9E
MLDINALAGTNWNYDFLEICNLQKDLRTGRPGLSGYAQKTKPLFAKIADRWSPELHAEWLQRHYLCLKLVMGATLQFGTAENAYRQNLQMAVPYLSYYGMFNAVRANLLSSPRSGWGKNSLTIGHEKAIEAYKSEIELLLSPDEVKEEVDLFVQAKRGRELFSYRFPSRGAPGRGGFFVYPDEAERFARVAAELALFNSFCLGAAIDRKFGKPSEWDGYFTEERELSKLWEHVLKGTLGDDDYIHIDSADKHRVVKIARTLRRPLPFVWMISEGGVEDFFNAFGPTRDSDHEFDPDEHWNRLVELP